MKNTNISFIDELPEFVRLERTTTVLRYNPITKVYDCDNGSWSINYKMKDGILYSADHQHDFLNNRIMTPCSIEDYRKEVGSYALK